MTSSERIMAALGASATSKRTPKILAIGDVNLWRRSFGVLPVHQGIQFAGLDDLNGPALSLACPDLIVSPIVTPLFDCIDVAFRLSALHYSGAYRALTRDLPNPAMVRREVRALCPDLDFDIVHVLDDGVIRF